MRLVLGGYGAELGGLAMSLIPIYGLSLAIKSLCVVFTVLPSARIFDFTLSFPLLNDFAVVANVIDNGDGSDGPPTIAQPSTPPTSAGPLTFLWGRTGLYCSPAVVSTGWYSLLETQSDMVDEVNS